MKNEHNLQKVQVKMFNGSDSNVFKTKCQVNK